MYLLITLKKPLSDRLFCFATNAFDFSLALSLSCPDVLQLDHVVCVPRDEWTRCNNVDSFINIHNRWRRAVL